MAPLASWLSLSFSLWYLRGAVDRDVGAAGGVVGLGGGAVEGRVQGVIRVAVLLKHPPAVLGPLLHQHATCGRYAPVQLYGTQDLVSGTNVWYTRPW